MQWQRAPSHRSVRNAFPLLPPITPVGILLVHVWMLFCCCSETHACVCCATDDDGQGGEFAFVAFGMAERLGIIEPQLCKLLLTTVAISMAATPALSNFSAWVADQVCVRVCDVWYGVV